MRDLMPALMKTILDSGEPQQALHHMAEFGRRIGARTGFLTLLAENPKTTRLLIDLFANSRFLSDLFVNRPELLDSLIRVDLTRIAKTGVEMREEVNASVGEALDIEDKLDRLRRYRVEEFIQLGLHDLGGELSFDESIAQLTGLAEACLNAALTLARGELDRRYGPPAMGRFAVLAMGKLGEAQLDYHSDLDLVFLYDSPEATETRSGPGGRIGAHEYYVKLGQRVIAYLSAPTREGIAYQLDMRLRPSGRAGPLVSSLEAFRRYHEAGSQLWERQALIRARFVAGDPRLGAEAEAIAERFAYQGNFRPEDLSEIDGLRMRMERELAREDGSRFDVKSGRGGLIDVEFLVQMLQLRFGGEHAGLRQKDTLGAAAALRELRLLGARDYRILVEGYTFLRRLGHRLRLQRDHDSHVLEREPGRLRAVAVALGYEERGRRSPGTALLRDYEKRRERIRACYERFFLEAERRPSRSVFPRGHGRGRVSNPPLQQTRPTGRWKDPRTGMAVPVLLPARPDEPIPVVSRREGPTNRCGGGFQTRPRPPAAPGHYSSSISAKSATTMSAPFSRRASASPWRSTPITSPKPPRRPACTPESASSTTTARSGLTPNSSAALR